MEDIVVGDGKVVKGSALITAHSLCWLEDGTQFDSSRRSSTCSANNKVIQGWVIGLQDMCVGGKRKLWVPAHLAYGERQMETMIPPYANLVFDIELLEVLTPD